MYTDKQCVLLILKIYKGLCLPGTPDGYENNDDRGYNHSSGKTTTGSLL